MRHRQTHLLAWTLIVSSMAGCIPLGAPLQSGRPVRQVYEGGEREPLVIRSERDPAAGPRTRPVIFPPKVFAVYVQEHLDLERDIKIGAHWVFFKLRDSSWVAEDIDREPAIDAKADDADIQPLRDAFSDSTFSKIVIPHE